MDSLMAILLLLGVFTKATLSPLFCFYFVQKDYQLCLENQWKRAIWLVWQLVQGVQKYHISSLQIIALFSAEQQLKNAPS